MNRALRVAQTFTGAAEFNVGGDYFKLLDAPYPVTVELLFQGSQVLYAQNAQAGFYQRARFDLVKITNPVSQAVAFLAASGEGGSDRLAGEVSVIDGSAVRSKSGLAFYSTDYLGGAVGNYAHLQLWNPGTSGKRAIVRQIGILVGAENSTVYLRHHNAALANPGSLLTAPRSKLVGSSDSGLQIRAENAGAAIGSVLAFNNIGPVSDTKLFTVSNPIVLRPGYGLVVQCNNANTGLGVTIEHDEEDNV